MSNSNALAHPPPLPRVLFFGRSCRLSALPLRALLAAGFPVAAIVTPAPPHRSDQPLPIRARALLPIVTAVAEPTLEQLASAYRVPVLETGTVRHPQVLEALADLAPDILIVSCFPWRIPKELVALASLGGLNVHPSALPAYRGPDPLFWVYRHGRLRTGVTVHQITPELDAGPILEQARFDVPLGLPGDHLEWQAAAIGARLLVRALERMARGQAQMLPQVAESASYFSWPRTRDLEITPEWVAWRAVHFLRGVIPLGYRPVYASPGQPRVTVRRLLRWCRAATEARARSQPRAVGLPVRDGVLLVEVEP